MAPSTSAGSSAGASGVGAAAGGGNVAHVAHVAGAIFGLLYAWRGLNLGGLAELPGRLLRARPRMRVIHPHDDGPTGRSGAEADGEERLQVEVDRILEKISRLGEAGLTAAERDTLTRASRRLKDRRG